MWLKYELNIRQYPGEKAWKLQNLPPRECLYIQQEAGYPDTATRIKMNILSMNNKILQYIQYGMQKSILNWFKQK